MGGGGWWSLWVFEPIFFGYKGTGTICSVFCHGWESPSSCNIIRALLPVLGSLQDVENNYGVTHITRYPTDFKLSQFTMRAQNKSRKVTGWIIVEVQLQRRADEMLWGVNQEQSSPTSTANTSPASSHVCGLCLTSAYWHVFPLFSAERDLWSPFMAVLYIWQLSIQTVCETWHLMNHVHAGFRVATAYVIHEAENASDHWYKPQRIVTHLIVFQPCLRVDFKWMPHSLLSVSRLFHM